MIDSTTFAGNGMSNIHPGVVNNYSKLKLSFFIFPIFFLVSIALLLYQHDSLSVDKYAQVQKDLFFFLNSKLSQFPMTMFNLTQFGDALVSLSFLSIFVIYAPKIWEGLISASLISCLICSVLKELFSVPRPAAVFDNNSFVVIGTKLTGHNSLPSGHAITIFTVLTVLLFAFMPQKLKHKILWFNFIMIIGLFLVFTRIGVGAHYPLDVIMGGAIGYISGLIGILINEKYKIWNWVNDKKYYPIFIILSLLFGCVALVTRMMSDNLLIYYLSLIALVISLSKIIYVYAKK